MSRPLGLITLSLALAIAGAIAVTFLPTSLLPPKALPLLEIRFQQSGLDAVSMEEKVASPLRSSLAPMSGLVSMESMCESESWLLNLHFSRDTDMEAARQEAADRIDQAMEAGTLLLSRPEIRLPTLTDLPVMYLYLQLQDDPSSLGFDESMVGLSQWAQELVSQLLEQQPDVGTVELAGAWERKWQIIPREEALQIRGVEPALLPELIQSATPAPVQVALKDGYRMRPVQIFSNQYEALDSILIQTQNAHFFLGEVASIQRVFEPAAHRVYLNGTPALCFAILQRDGAKLNRMAEQIASVCEDLAAQQPRVRFVPLRDQTEILDLAIQNMWQGLFLSIIMASLLFFLFMRQGLASLLIGLAVGVALCWTLGAFWVLGIGINSLTLAGMVIGIGLMVDNAIILLNQIRLRMEENLSLPQAIGKSMSDLALPLISSTATTIVVFLPLRAGGDLVNALFSDQAISMSLSLFASFLVTLFLIPPVYLLLGKRFPRINTQAPARFWAQGQALYHRVLDFLLHHPSLSWGLTFAILALGMTSLWWMPRQLFPPLERKQLLIRYAWPNEVESERMREEMTACVDLCGNSLIHSSMHTGQQPFVRDPDPLQPNESELLLEFADGKTARIEAENIRAFLSQGQGVARWRVSSMPTPFEYLFINQSDVSDLRGYWLEETRSQDPDEVESLRQSLSEDLGIPLTVETPLEGVLIVPKMELLRRSGLTEEALSRQVKWHLGGSFEMRMFGMLQAVEMGTSITPTVRSVADIPIILPSRAIVPLHTLANTLAATKFSRIHADEHGVFIPFYYPPSSLLPTLKEKIKQIDAKRPEVLLSYSPVEEKENAQLRDLSLAILMASVLLFLILTAQFESFVLPWIILLEIPIVLAATLALLFFCGQTLNLMSLIGLIAMMGIIINDSILKLDAIQKKIGQGLSHKAAILRGSTEKLSSIVLTSLTTMVCTLPFFVAADIGSQLQRPLAIALGGGIAFGLLVTLFLVPVWMVTLLGKQNHSATPHR